MPKNHSSDNDDWEEWERLANGFQGSVEELEELMDEQLADDPKKSWRRKRLRQEDRDVRFRTDED
ncbi:MAG: hypothetical protein VX895_02425 [Chloroflexota bacterium]|nr:hypothetical protein [Chloroflexota bacterium]